MIGRIQLPHWQRHPHCKVKAVADVNIESARAVASEFSVPDVYADYHELLDDDAIDAVLVCTPPFLHNYLLHVEKVISQGRGCVKREDELSSNIVQLLSLNLNKRSLHNDY